MIPAGYTLSIPKWARACQRDWFATSRTGNHVHAISSCYHWSIWADHFSPASPPLAWLRLSWLPDDGPSEGRTPVCARAAPESAAPASTFLVDSFLHWLPRLAASRWPGPCSPAGVRPLIPAALRRPGQAESQRPMPPGPSRLQCPDRWLGQFSHSISGGSHHPGASHLIPAGPPPLHRTTPRSRSPGLSLL